jgi:hypothetical protein
VNVEPVISWPLRWRSRARLARSAISAAMTPRPFRSASRTTGVTSPSSIATAMPTWTRWKRRIASPPRRVARGHAPQRQRRALDDQIVDRDLAAIAEQAVQPAAEREQRLGIEAPHQVEVRHVALGLGEPRGDALAHVGGRHVDPVAGGGADGGERGVGRRDRRRRRARAPGPRLRSARGAGRGGGRSRRGRAHVALDDATAGAGAGDGAQIDAELDRQGLGQRRREQLAARGGSRSGSRGSRSRRSGSRGSRSPEPRAQGRSRRSGLRGAAARRSRGRSRAAAGAAAPPPPCLARSAPTCLRPPCRGSPPARRA